MITTLTGSNSFVLKAELAGRIKQFKQDYGDLALEQFDAEETDFEVLQQAFTSLSLFSSEKLTIIKNPSKNKDFVNKCEELITPVGDSTNIILTEDKLDKRSSLYKLLKTKTDFKELKELDNNGLVKWLVTAAADKGGRLTNDSARYLIERVGNDQLLLSSELEKLLIYDNNITKVSIDLLTENSPQSTIFQLLESAFSSSAKRTLNLYKEQRELKVEPQQIIAMLTWQLHIFALIKAAKDKSTDQIARDAKLSPFVVGKSLSIVNKLPIERLKAMIAELVNLDETLKSRSIDPDMALQKYLLELKTQ